MTTGEIGFLALVVGAWSLLGGVLAWASWMERRETGARRNRAQAASEIRDGRARHAV